MKYKKGSEKILIERVLGIFKQIQLWFKITLMEQPVLNDRSYNDLKMY